MRRLKKFVKPIEVKLRSKMSHWPPLVSQIFLCLSSLNFSFTNTDVVTIEDETSKENLRNRCKSRCPTDLRFPGGMLSLCLRFEAKIAFFKIDFDDKQAWLLLFLSLLLNILRMKWCWLGLVKCKMTI